MLPTGDSLDSTQEQPPVGAKEVALRGDQVRNYADENQAVDKRVLVTPESPRLSDYCSYCYHCHA